MTDEERYREFLGRMKGMLDEAMAPRMCDKACDEEWQDQNAKILRLEIWVKERDHTIERLQEESKTMQSLKHSDWAICCELREILDVPDGTMIAPTAKDRMKELKERREESAMYCRQVETLEEQVRMFEFDQQTAHNDAIKSQKKLNAIKDIINE